MWAWLTQSDTEPPDAGSTTGSARAGNSTLIRVSDGDTIVVRYEGRDEKIRLLRIDTPERDDPGYHEATTALRGLVSGRELRIEFERPGHEERDRYGRLLAYVFANDTNTSVEMVRLGWTPFWTRYGKGRYATDFKRAESEARHRAR